MKKKIIIFGIVSLFVLGLISQVQAQKQIDLLWHCDTYVPAGYRARALPVRGSSVTVVAMPLAQSPGSNLQYDWYLDRDYMRYSSGVGQQSFTFQVSEWPGYKQNVRVKVSSPQGEEIGYNSISIQVFEPGIVFEDLADSEIEMSPGDRQTLTATPYFFTTPDLDWQWWYNNNETEPRLENPNILDLRIPWDSYTGLQRKLEMRARNPNNLLEKVMKEVTIKIMK